MKTISVKRNFSKFDSKSVILLQELKKINLDRVGQKYLRDAIYSLRRNFRVTPMYTHTIITTYNKKYRECATSLGFTSTIDDNKICFQGSIRNFLKHKRELISAIRRVRELTKSINNIRRIGKYTFDRTKSLISQWKDLKQAEKFEEKIYTATRRKNPATKNRHIGIEIECISKLTQRELIKKLPANLVPFVTFKKDFSILASDDYQYVHEVVVCAEERKIKGLVEEISTFLKENKCTVNASCGLHVHVDTRKICENEYIKLAQKFAKFQKILFAIQPKSRQKNEYCKRLRKATLNKKSRYYAINTLSRNKYNTLEIRVHSGTIEAIKINNFIDLLTKIRDSKAVFKRITLTKKLLVQLGLKPEQATYFTERAKSFAA